MRVLLLGSTGMVGQGVLLACLESPLVTQVVAVARGPLQITSPKLTVWQRSQFFDWEDAAGSLSGFDACFFALGISSLGKSEAEYRRTTVEIPVALAGVLLRASPQASFVLVTGAGTRRESRQMWARTKAAAEDALLAMPFRAVYCMRPGLIQPMDGVRSRVGWYNAVYTLTGVLFPVLKRLFPGSILSTREFGRAIIAAAAYGAPERVLEAPAIVRLAAGDGQSA